MSQDLYTLLGLKVNPFTPAASAENYFFTQEASQILEELHYGITSRKGFLLLLGEVGVGKTSLLMQLLKKINQQEDLETAWIFNTSLDQKEFLKAIAEDFGLKIDSQSNLSNIIGILHQHFLEVNQKGHNCAIIVDEAHNLSYKALEALRMLSNLEVNETKLVQILITGQPELDIKLKQPELRQLRSRILLFQTLHSLNQKDTAYYVHYKLNSAGSQLRLSRSAIRLLFTVTGGNPRMIHLIMDRVLHIVASRNLKHISAKHIVNASLEIAKYHYGIKQKLNWHRTKQILLAAGICILILMGSSTLPIWPSHQGNTVLWRSISSGMNNSFRQKTVFVQEVHKRPKPANRTGALAQESDKSRKNSSSSAVSSARNSSTPNKLAETRVQNRQNSIDKKSSLQNSTAVLDNSTSQKLQDFLKIYNLQKYKPRLRKAIIEKNPEFFIRVLASKYAAFKLERLPREKLIKYAALPWKEITGAKPARLVIWKPLLQIQKKFPNRSSQKDILMFQKMLSELGYYSGPWDGKFGKGTYRAMEEFQRVTQIPRTHGPDARTLFWLCVKYEQLKQQDQE